MYPGDPWGKWEDRVEYIALDPDREYRMGNYKVPRGLVVPLLVEEEEGGEPLPEEGEGGGSGFDDAHFSLRWDRVARGMAWVLGHDPDRPLSAEYSAFLRAFHPQAAQSLTAEGAAIGEEGDLEEALWLLRAATAIDPTHRGAQYNLGLCALALSAYWEEHDDPASAEAAASIAEEALRNVTERLDPHFALAHFSLGALYAQTGRTDEAKREIREAIGLGLEPEQLAEARQLLADLHGE